MASQLATELEFAMESDVRPTPILIVDDDESQVLALAHRLENQGYETLAAHSGEDALTLARLHRPRLVLLDLRLPDMDGFAVCSALTDHPETCTTPVIILSGMERADIIRQTRAVGSSYFVRKPYDPNVLLTVIERALENSRDW